VPPAADILAQLTAIARDGVIAAVAWHVAIATMLVTIALGWRPSRRFATRLMAGPMITVAGFAFAYGNPLNGAVFAIASVALLALAAHARDVPVTRAPRWAIVLGLLSIAFAWTYPHFLEDRDAAVYLVAAPVGLLPCPTLALVIGGALLAGGLERPVTLFLATLGLAYAAVGVLRLGVVLDVGLAVSALALLVRAPATPAAARSRGTRRRRALLSRRTPGTPRPTRA
jgi:hypothetical protein